MVRLTASGQNDTTFAGNGVAPGPIELEAVGRLADGALVGAGWLITPAVWSRFALTRYRVDGSIDTSFGDGGVALAFAGAADSAATDVRALPDTRLLVAGRMDWDFALARYFSQACGNGTVESGEACDDGNVADGDGCSATCTVEQTSTTTTLPPGRPCSLVPSVGCRTSVVPETARLLVKDRDPDDADLIVWKWVKGGATAATDFGDPLQGDDQALCVYDGDDLLVATAVAPAGAICGTKPCWKGLGDPPSSRGYKYRDAARTNDGLLKVQLRPGADGKARVIVKGKGPNLPDPVLPLSLPVVVQLQAGNGSCWEARYVADGVQRNDATRFKGRGGGTPRVPVESAP
jgi:cysteine-rich repeat protein